MSLSDSSWASGLICSRGSGSERLHRPAFLSAAGAPWLVEYELSHAKGRRLKASLERRPWSLWRYQELLPLRDSDIRIDLGEGGTPLIRLRRLAPAGVEVLVKEEGGNPTGSFKARGLSLAVNRARELGAPGVQLPSAGNAALALCAYAAAAALPARVALPSDTPGAIVERCRAHGARVIQVDGTLVEAGLALKEMGGDYWDLSTLKEPYRVEGKKTMGLELAEQLGWSLPDWILYPTGGGTGIVGMAKGFDELRQLGLIGERRPRLVAVQMAGCAPLVRAFDEGLEEASPWEEPRTRVWGLRVPRAIGDFLVLRAVRESGGLAVAVPEEDIGPAQRELAAREGLLAGPEGAACLLALRWLERQGRLEQGARVVLFQTGNPANYLETAGLERPAGAGIAHESLAD